MTKTPPNPIRVLWLAKGLGPGGMERLLVNHARFGDRERFVYSAAYVSDRPNSVVAELEALDVPCHRLGSGRAAPPGWISALRRLIARERPDVVHAHSPLPGSVARVVARVVSPRPHLVYTEHNSWDCYSLPTRLVNLATFPLDDHQFAVSAAAAASPPARLASRVEQLTHGIDLDHVRGAASRRTETRANLGIGSHDVVVTVVANLRVEKAYDVLLDAAKLVFERCPEVMVLSVGQGPLADDMAARRDSLRLGDRFRFLGFRNDVREILSASDIFALSSRQEGLPLSYMEACALGLPSVVTAVGGLRDFVVTNGNGIIVEPERPDLLAEGIIRLAQDRLLRSTCAAGALATAAEFDARRAVQRQEAVYRELVN